MTCEVIMDLIPMYADKSASEETRILVENHIKECPSCKSFLKSCNKTESKSVFSGKDINKIRDKLKCAECDISSVDAEFARLSRRIKKRNTRRNLISILVCAAMLAYIVTDIINTVKKSGGNK
jgi:predicted anti-sigma-YlaC factor YlaD